MDNKKIIITIDEKTNPKKPTFSLVAEDMHKFEVLGMLEVAILHLKESLKPKKDD